MEIDCKKSASAQPITTNLYKSQPVTIYLNKSQQISTSHNQSQQVSTHLISLFIFAKNRQQLCYEQLSGR
jgi:hypothetical protein